MSSSSYLRCYQESTEGVSSILPAGWPHTYTHTREEDGEREGKQQDRIASWKKGRRGHIERTAVRWSSLRNSGLTELKGPISSDNKPTGVKAASGTKGGEEKEEGVTGEHFMDPQAGKEVSLAKRNVQVVGFNTIRRESTASSYSLFVALHEKREKEHG